jgi:voltage-gated potassium channel Kch
MRNDLHSPTDETASARRGTLRTCVWLGSIAAVLAIGLWAFPREYEGVGFPESLYYTIRLFVLEYDLPRFPRSWPLIAIHFAAPLIAVSAVWTAVNRLFNLSPALRTRWRSNHVVVCGVGRAGKIIVATLKSKGVEVVGVDLGPPELFEDWNAEHGVPMVYGSFFSRQLLRRAGAARARSILFTSGDDLANLEGALGAYDWLNARNTKPRLIWTHVANEKLRHTVRGAVRSSGPLRVRFFDTYWIAATRMVDRHFNREVRQGVTHVTLLGFGKFGHDLLEVMVRDLGPEERLVFRVIDCRDRSDAVMSLASELGVSDRVEFNQANINDLDLVDERDSAFFLCTDDDLGNLAAALMLAGDAGATFIYVRMARWPISALADHVGKDRGVTFVNIKDLVVEGIVELPGIFEPPTLEQLEQADD